MTTSNKILISEAFASDLATRETADKLFRIIKKNKAKTIYLDFSHVNFVSRSFAHQYELNKIQVKKRLNEIHMNREVRKMFSVVEDNPKANFADIYPYKSVSISLRNLD